MLFHLLTLSNTHPVAVLRSELPLRDSSLNRRMPNVAVAVTWHDNPCMTAQLQLLVSQQGD